MRKRKNRARREGGAYICLGEFESTEVCAEPATTYVAARGDVATTAVVRELNGKKKYIPGDGLLYLLGRVRTERQHSSFFGIADT